MSIDNGQIAQVSETFFSLFKKHETNVRYMKLQK